MYAIKNYSNNITTLYILSNIINMIVKYIKIIPKIQFIFLKDY